MIICSLKDVCRYNTWLTQLETVRQYSKQLEEAAPGRYWLEGGICASLKEGLTEAAGLPVVLEAHRENVDVHVLLRGRERILWQNIEGLECCRDYDPASDSALYISDGGTPIVLRPGDMAVCFPEDGHRASLSVSAPESYRKIVFKLPLAKAR